MLTVVSNGMIETFTSPSFLAAFFKVSSSVCEADLRLVIFPLDDMEPVLSRASATSSFLMPQATSALTLMFRFCWPNTLVKVVGTLPVPVRSSLKLLSCGLEKVGVMTMWVTSARLNRAPK